jgi:hypothetical protein
MQWSWVTWPCEMTYSKGASWVMGFVRSTGKAHRRMNWLCLPHMIIAVAVEQMSWKSVTLKGVPVWNRKQRPRKL